jgi:hypothetical protein
MIPTAAKGVIVVLCGLLPGLWGDAPMYDTIPGQIEQETCISLTSSKCFSPRAELKTSREYGFGLGQLTVTSRFNAFNEVKAQAPALLGDWQWTDRYDPRRQLIALLVMDRDHYRACQPLMDGPLNAMACALAKYNGGAGGFNSDRRLCGNTQGCNPRVWFGNIEQTSTKPRATASGYGQSFFDINRGYVRNVLLQRRFKYEELMKCST